MRCEVFAEWRRRGLGEDGERHAMMGEGIFEREQRCGVRCAGGARGVSTGRVSGGRMVIPLGEFGAQQLHVIEKRGGTMEQRAVLPVAFVPMTGKAMEAK